MYLVVRLGWLNHSYSKNNYLVYTCLNFIVNNVNKLALHIAAKYEMVTLQYYCELNEYICLYSTNITNILEHLPVFYDRVLNLYIV